MLHRRILVVIALLFATLVSSTVSLTIKPNVPSKIGKLHGSLPPQDASDKRLSMSTSNTNFQSYHTILGGATTAASTSPSTLIQVYQGYVKLCETKPVLTKSVTAAIVNAIGDILSQIITSQVTKAPFRIKWIRLGAFLLCGGLYVGPFVHLWYEQLWKLGRFLERTYGSSKNVQTLAQLFLDQTVGVIIFFPSYFYVYEYLEALVAWRVPSFFAAHAQCKKQLASVLIMQYYIWPISNWINFAYVPESLRVLFRNLVAVFWNAFLCTRLS